MGAVFNIRLTMLSQNLNNSLRKLLIFYFLFSGLILGLTGIAVIGSLPHLGSEFRVSWLPGMEMLTHDLGDAAKLESLETLARAFEGHVHRIADRTLWGALVLIAFGGLHLAVAVVAALIMGRGPSSGVTGEGIGRRKPNLTAAIP